MKHRIETKRYNLVVIGGGPAGMAVAHSASKAGLDRVLLLERAPKLGGVLNQCIHVGFGLHYFKKELTGTEYSTKYRKLLIDTGVEIELGSNVLEIDQKNNVKYVNSAGVKTIIAKKIVLATGCRERTREMLTIPGTRPAGIYTAGLAQEMTNIYGLLPGKKVVIVGSGDIGLIMARRLTLEGAEVLAVLEIQDKLSGLIRNKVQCLDDFGIPLYLNHQLLEVYGKDRVEKVRYLNETTGEERFLSCDTVLFSVGLIPERDLVYGLEASEENGIYFVGNADFVHDLADNVTKSGEKLGEQIAKLAGANKWN